jgi:hypothetical protein
MSLLLPLGLLGLISIVVLILIYIIKPNYQQKVISSTYVWKVSLRYKKKSVPINRLRNILIFICQLLILTSISLLLAMPYITAEKTEKINERVIILDQSASMLVETNGETRYERAVDEVKYLVGESTKDGGLVSVILAGDEVSFLAQRQSEEDVDEIYEKLSNLVADGNLQCTYGVANIDEAVGLADEVLVDNPDSEVILVTATEYIDKGSITVVDVSEADEWNVAILNCKAELVENYYTFSIDVGCYGRSQQVTVYCQVTGANGDSTIVLSKTEFFSASEEEQTITFNADDQLSLAGIQIYSFDQLYVYVQEADNFSYDNVFFLYGGTKPTIKIQYASSNSNNFFSTVIMNFREQLKDKWNIELTQTKSGATKGFDLYIYEHTMPAVVPTDGVVLLVDPDTAPEGSGFKLGDVVSVNSDSTLAAGVAHALTNNIDPDNITVSEYRKISADDSYQELLYYAGNPVMLVKEEQNLKIIVLTINLNKSNLPVKMEFPIMMYNIFDYFIPSTLSGYTYQIGDTVTLNARGPLLGVEGPGTKLSIDEFPAQLVLTQPGTYTLTQTTMLGDYIVENFYVGISNYESNITKQVDALPTLHINKKVETQDKDLLVYFAAVLVALLFIEWWLQSRNYF